MIWFIIILILIIGLLLYMHYEAGHTKTVEIDISKEEDSLKIMHLSDIHIPLLRIPGYVIKNSILKTNPDIIIITGDFIERMKNIPRVSQWLLKIQTNCPMYACLGNHEYKAFKENNQNRDKFIEAIKKVNVNLLINQSITVEIKGNKYNLIGLDDYKKGSPDIEAAFSNLDVEAKYNIVFSHNPDQVLTLPKNKTNLFLCGHFHGGQIWIPFGLEFFCMRSEKLCKNKIVKGLHNINGIKTYINSGLGNVLVPFRFLSRPEITIIKI